MWRECFDYGARVGWAGDAGTDDARSTRLDARARS